MKATHEGLRKALVESAVKGTMPLEKEEVRFLLLVLDRDEQLALLASKVVDGYLGDSTFCMFCTSPEVEDDGFVSHFKECHIGIMQDILLGFDVMKDIIKYETNNQEAEGDSTSSS